MKTWTRRWPTSIKATTVRRTREIGEDERMVHFQVIGELRDNPRHLLMHGDDGRYYGYDLESGEIHPIEPDERWAIDLACPMTKGVVVPVESVAS
jgi:hypothetical protein